MWYRTCNLQFWWPCPITFGQNPKTFRINSDSLFGKISSFYVECSFTENCRAFCPESPKVSFAIKIPCTGEKKIWQVFRELLAQNPKNFSSYRKKITKIFLRPREMKFRQIWLKHFCSQSAKLFRANAEKHFSQTVRLDSCRMQFWQPCWKPFAQRPEVFRAESEKVSQNTYFGHVESNFDNRAENL